MMYVRNTQSGFSLVETLVAITILLIVISGPLAISTSTARSTSFSSEQVEAFFLAQEGAELAQKIRDDLLLAAFLTDPQDGWDDFWMSLVRMVIVMRLLVVAWNFCRMIVWEH